MKYRPVKAAMIGVGAISGIYLQNITHTFREVELVGVCDLIPDRAEKGAAYVKAEIEQGAGVREPKIYKDMYEAFNDPEVEVILNLTRPYEHFEVTKQALLHGKHVYSEKPLGVDMEEAGALIALAEEKNLRLGGAPDTFMGAGIQTARRLIDDGYIGDIVGPAVPWSAAATRPGTRTRSSTISGAAVPCWIWALITSQPWCSFWGKQRD